MRYGIRNTNNHLGAKWAITNHTPCLQVGPAGDPAQALLLYSQTQIESDRSFQNYFLVNLWLNRPMYCRRKPSGVLLAILHLVHRAPSSKEAQSWRGWCPCGYRKWLGAGVQQKAWEMLSDTQTAECKIANLERDAEPSEILKLSPKGKACFSKD